MATNLWKNFDVAISK